MASQKAVEIGERKFPCSKSFQAFRELLIAFTIVLAHTWIVGQKQNPASRGTEQRSYVAGLKCWWIRELDPILHNVKIVRPTAFELVLNMLLGEPARVLAPKPFKLYICHAIGRRSKEQRVSKCALGA